MTTVYKTSQYKKNSFSAENLSTSLSFSKNNINVTTKVDINFLMKKILAERRREKKNIIILGVTSLSLVLIFYFI